MEVATRPHYSKLRRVSEDYYFRQEDAEKQSQSHENETSDGCVSVGRGCSNALQIGLSRRVMNR